MTNQLWLPGWTVTKAETIDDVNHVSATFDVAPTDCQKCGIVDAPLYKHGTKTITYVDAPVHGLPTHIDVKRARYRCRVCEGTFMQPLPDMDDERRMTLRCKRYIEKQCLLKPNTHVAEDVGIDEKVVRQIGREQAERLFADHNRVIKAPRILGIDELGLNGDMRAIFVDIEDSWPIELLPNRWVQPVTNFLMNLAGREKVEIVTTDMWKPYRQAVRYAMPQALLIVDKWHVMRMANDAMETARRVYQGGHGISKETRRQLKKGRSIFLKRPYQLSQKQLLDLDGWLKNTPELAGAYETKERFMNIWRAKTALDAKRRLDAWRTSIPPHLFRLFKPVVTATTNWEAEILAYFIAGKQWTNAATEARNGVIKKINRAGSGYSFDMIRARALFSKRPARVAKDKLRAQAEPAPPPMIKCCECKALFPRNGGWPYDEIYQNGHVFEYTLICGDCLRFNTEGWLNHDPVSTGKSE